MAFGLETTDSGRLMYLPAGQHEVTVTQGKKVVSKTVLVTPDSVAPINAQLAHIRSLGKSPMMDFNHADDNASFRPTGFVWSETPAPGVWAIGEWTGRGKEAVQGKEYSHFSPRVHVEEGVSPARVITRVSDRSPNMGGLVNNPAFSKISPVQAKAAGAPSDSQSQETQTTHTMNQEEIAALQAKNKELASEIAALQAKDKTDTAIAAALAAKESELRANKAELELEALKAKNADLTTAATERAKKDADAAIAAAVARGALPPKDEAMQAKWREVILADPANAALLAALPSTVQSGKAISARTAQTGRVERGQIGGKDAVIAYGAIVAKNAAILERNSPEKARLAQEAAAIFAADMRGREDEWMGVSLEDALEAIKAADSTSATIGTLAGTLVLQRGLPLLKFNYPMLQTLFSDFSDAVGLWGQTEMTRIPIAPAVTEYDATLDTNGRPKGFVVVTPAQSVDVPITLTKHVGIPMVFGVQTLASTVRNLFAEQSAGAINALGGYFVDMATALMTAGNFNAYAQITDAGGATTNGSTTVTLASTAGCYPGQEISGTGIPTGAHVVSVTDSTHVVITLAATADGTGVTITLGGGKVPTLYPTYVKALADFNFASLGEIGAAFDNNKVPYEQRSIMLNASYYARLTQDPTVNNFFAATRSPDIINKGILPELNGFVPQKAPFFPTSSNRVGFAYHPAAIALKSRLPQDFTRAVSAMVPGNITTVTDPDTGLSVLHVERVDVVGRYAESSIEVMLGANLGDRRAGMVVTSA